MVTAVYQPNLAGNGDRGGFLPFELFAGEKEIVTDRAPKAVGSAWGAFTPLAKNAAGQLVVWDPAAAAPMNAAVGVSAYPAGAAAVTEESAFYVSAFFNHAAMIWPAATNTMALKKAAFVGTEVRIGTLR